MKIYSKLDNEINRVIKNFNQKINRLETNKNKLLPTKINKKMFKELNSTKDIRRKLNELKRFSRRGAEDVVTTSSGTSITKYELREISIAKRVAKSKITREIKKLESTKPSIAGIPTDFTFAQMGDENYLNLKAKREFLNSKNLENLSRSELKSLRKSIDTILNQKKSQNFKGSYIDMIQDTAFQTGYNKEKLKVIVDKLDKIKNKEFLDIFKKDKLVQSIIFYYSSDKNGNLALDNANEINQILDSLHDYLNE